MSQCSQPLLCCVLQTVGNHEWDKGLSALKQYLDAQDNKDVLAANIDFHGHEIRHKIKPYVVKQVKGKKVRNRYSAVVAHKFVRTCMETGWTSWQQSASSPLLPLPLMHLAVLVNASSLAS